MENTAKNLFETLAETQKQVMDNMTNASQHMAKSFVSNEMNSDFFKKWYDSQMAFFNQNGQSADTNPLNMFTSWMKNQMNMGNDMQNNFKGFTGMNGMNSDLTSMYTSLFANMQQAMKGMSSTGDMKNAMGGMFNNAEMMMKTYEMWMPMIKMITDKTYTPDAFTKMINPSMFKDVMDKMMSFQPDFAKNMTDMTAVREQMVKMMDFFKGNFDQGRNQFNSFNPMNNGMFNNMSEQYNSMWNSMNQAAAPMMKMMGNTDMSNKMNAANEIISEFNNYMIKNTQVQYATYVSGNEAMNEFAENIYTKMKNGEDMSNFMNVYSEWLNTNDKHLTKLFSTAEYSKLQAELNTFGMKLKQHMNAEMEKSLKNIPVVPRSEMDELYKTVYELRKRINVLEKQLD
ncbi:MAG: poly(R)-hydroxyalkanoic acid synthase subunit PhaE, partial [Bacteroidota bacterium]